MDSLPQLVCVLDASGHILRVNREAQRWGLGAAETAVGKTLHAYLHPGCTEPGCALAGVWARGSATIGMGWSYAAPTRDDRIGRDLEIHVHPIGAVSTGHSNLPGRAVAVFRDVTNERESETKYRRLFEAESSAIFVADTETGRVLEANPAACAMYGYAGEEILQLRHLDLTAEPEATARAMQETRLSVPLRWHRRKDGAIFPVEITGSALEIHGRRVMIAGIRDITELRRQQESLHRYATRLEMTRVVYRSILATRPNEASATWALASLCQLVPCRWASVVVPSVEEGIAHVALLRPPTGTIAAESAVPLGALSRELLMARAPAEAIAALSQFAPVREMQDWGLDMLLPLVARGELVGVMGLGLDQSGPPSEEASDIAREVGDQLALALADARLFRLVHEQRTQMQTLAARMAEMQESERRQLARELHDRVGQNLTALGINLNIVRGQLRDSLNAKTESRLAAALKLLEETVDHIRDVMAELRPPVLDDYGLLAALRWYSQRFEYFTGVSTQVEGEEISPRLPQAIEIALFRITQEALTNVAKHAEASQVMVRLAANGGLACLSIEDNGHGFDVGATRRAGASVRWGLTSMQERAMAVGGRQTVQSVLGEGTQVLIEVPRRLDDDSSASV